jgi:hypothetical protein
MSVYVVTGKLGQGKTLITVCKLIEYLEKGCKVASNLDLYMENYHDKKMEHKGIYRLPDKPTITDLEAIGRGAPDNTYDESKFGALVLDECGTWFNSRGWNDPTRRPVIDWFLHSRKLGWDVYLIIQDIDMLDKQARTALAEHTVYTRRLDRIRIPILTSFIKMATRLDVRLPRLHVGVVKYGDNKTMPTAERWIYRGTDRFTFYDTQQVFISDDMAAVYSVLDPWTLTGRYLPKRDWLRYLYAALNIPVSIFAYALLRSYATITGRSPAIVAERWRRLNRSDYRGNNPADRQRELPRPGRQRPGNVQERKELAIVPQPGQGELVNNGGTCHA